MANPVTVVSSGGVPVVDATPLSGNALTNPTSYGVPVTPTTEARVITIVLSGAPPVVFIDVDGVTYLPGGGTAIQLSASTIAEDASVGDLVGLLSVSNGSGTYAFTLTDDAGGLFAIDGVDDTRLEVASALSPGSYAIAVTADNGVDPPLTDKPFLITVTAVVVVPPTAPVLAMDPLWTTADSTPDFTIDIDDSIGEGDDVQLQIQAAGGDWSVLLHDSTHAITAPEDAANEIDLSNGALSNGNYEARARVNDGVSNSDWSNTVSFTVAATGTDSIELEDTTDLIELEDTTDTIELETV